MNRPLFLTIFFLLFAAACRTAQPVTVHPQLPIAEVTFDSYFGSRGSEESTMYCLLGTGFFRTPRSDNSDSLIRSWIQKHPTAMLIPVSSLALSKSVGPNASLVYCWVVQGTDTLNNYLIRQGAFPGGTMQRPRTWNEMEKWEKDLYKDADGKPSITVQIGKREYDTFLDQIRAAELYARTNKLGIWGKEPEE